MSSDIKDIKCTYNYNLQPKKMKYIRYYIDRAEIATDFTDTQR